MQRCQSEGKGCCDMIKGPTSWMACGSAWWDGGDGGDEDKSECPAWRLSIYENDVQLCKQARYHKKERENQGHGSSDIQSFASRCFAGLSFCHDDKLRYKSAPCPAFTTWVTVLESLPVLVR